MSVDILEYNMNKLKVEISENNIIIHESDYFEYLHGEDPDDVLIKYQTKDWSLYTLYEVYVKLCDELVYLEEVVWMGGKLFLH